MAIQSNFPSIRPSLLLDFANSKRLDPRVTFTRASTATYYDGVTVAKAEENLVTYSQDFSNAAWVQTGTTASVDAATAPDGTSTADVLNEGTDNSRHFARAAFGGAVTANATVTASVFAKYVDAQYLVVSLYDNDSSVRYAAITVDIQNGTHSQSANVGTGYSVVSYTITSAGNSWYRVSLTATFGATASAPRFGVGFSDSATPVSTYGGFPTFTGTSRTAQVWGAQAELRSAVTAYTATTTQTITNYVPRLLTAAAGVARFDHNPVTGDSLGLLIEESRINRLTYSDDFSNAAWTKTRSSITSNTIIAPDGSLTGDKLIDTTDNNTHFTTQTFTGTAVSHSFTVYAKAGERTFIALRLFNGTSEVGLAYYNLSTGATGTVSSGTAAITNVGNGWYQCSLVATLAASASCTADIQLASADNTNSYTGDAYAGAFIWGAQVELGAFPTSYIPTVGSTVTRSADAASMTGTNFSSWYNASEGTLYADTTSPFTFGPFSINDGSGSNRIEIRSRANGVTGTAGVIDTNGVTQFTPSNFTFANVNKLAFAYKFNDSACVLNGGSAATDTSVIIPVVTRAQFGLAAALPSTGNIRKLAYYSLRLTNAQLQAITG